MSDEIIPMRNDGDGWKPIDMSWITSPPIDPWVFTAEPDPHPTAREMRERTDEWRRRILGRYPS